MSLHYLLDGYNIIKAVPALADKKFQDGRIGLVHLIEHFQPQGSLRNKVTIVFDGKPGIWSDPVAGTVKVIFTLDESADDKIKRMVNDAANRKQIVVVTNDRDIRYHVRSLGAAVLNVEEFYGKIRRPSGRGPVGESARAISKTAEYEITAELEKIWLSRPDKKE